MQRMSVVFQAWVTVLYLAGCGSGDDDGAASPPLGALTPTPDGPGTSTDPAAPSAGVPGAESMGAGAEGVDPALGLGPSDPAPETPAPVAAGGNGRLVGGACTLVCLDDSTDPDAQGQT